MHLIEPHGQKRKWDIRFRNHDGRTVKVAGERDQSDAQRLGNRIAMLVKAKGNGDPPPMELQPWIDNMPSSLADRLVHLGLLSQQRLERSKSVFDHIETYGGIVAARKSNKPRHSKQQESKVRRVYEELNITRFDHLTAAKLLRYLGKLDIAVSTRRSYIIAMKDFGDEMVRLGAAKGNPFANVEPPGQYEDPEYERAPLTVKQFQMLTKYLGTFERYKGQKSRWTAHDRKLIFWTAVTTGYRVGELRSLIRANLYLDEKPPLICLKARHTKNKTDGEVPIPRDLAVALKKYVAGMAPTSRIFPFPSTCGSVVDMLRRDLTGAGVVWKLPTGEVIDFHTLRSTCITWWLDVHGLSPKRVQVLARLKTLPLVSNYSRNLRLEDFAWLNKGPKLTTTLVRKRAG